MIGTTAKVVQRFCYVEKEINPMHLQDLMEDRARKGDGASAITYALLELARQQERLATAVDKIGMNSMQPDGVPGALEKLAMEVGSCAESLGSLAVIGAAIDDLAAKLPDPPE